METIQPITIVLLVIAGIPIGYGTAYLALKLAERSVRKMVEEIEGEKIRDVNNGH